MRVSRYGRALKHPNFRLNFIGQLTSLVGTWMETLAQAWLVYRLTDHSELMLGVVGFCSRFPVFVLSPIGGAVADRFSRHRVILATQVAAMLLAAVLAALTLLERITIGEVLVIASLLGTINAFNIPARQAFIVEIVGPEDLMNAIALNSSMVNGARIVGPAIAGAVIAVVGEGYCFVLNSLSFLAVIATLLRMRDLPPAPAAERRSALRRIHDGWRFIVGARPVLALLLLVGLASLTGMPYVVLMPAFAEEVLGRGAGGLGVLMGASGAGALTAAVMLAGRTTVSGLGRRVGLAAVGFGLALMVFSLSRSFWMSVALLVPVGFCMLTQFAGSNTLIQSMTPDPLKGRVMAAYSMMVLGMAPFGALLSGFVATRLGPALAVTIGGAACIAGGAAFVYKLRSLRAEARALLGGRGGEPGPSGGG